ncbi:hypothetical protein [Aliivibrio sifiae]|uniref:DNA-binding protein n=1 Tax=Aliivibrio sifiae TaxID=566293 RepID=A0A2S7XIB1_9GAMM|nr:hypothetical protein [Aliivibrio sifiae]PQJ93161.1 DNA-binding protein [Aliivibrio sifiae]GLR75997.1 hypothetical protein GCM10007855_28710 [Aliivibrio sifiae]
MTLLVLDGESINLKNCRVNPSFEIKEKDMSGFSSSTSNAEQGEKGAELAISGLIDFRDITKLSRLYELARMKKTDGTRKVFVIGSDVAKGLKIRQVRFAGRVQAVEQDGLLAWQVSFQLREHLSVAEQQAEKNNKKRTVDGETPAINADTLNKQIEAQLQ